MISRKRRKTRTIRVGKLLIGGDNPVSVQSMCNTDTRDIRATLRQISELEDAGCEIVRVAVPNMDAAQKLGAVKKRMKIPLVADIHFDWRLALEAVKQGVDKIRINPGNIGDKSRVIEVVKACKSAGIPIRIGVNSGSLKSLKKITGKPKWTTGQWAEIMAKEALDEVKVLEDMNFRDIVVSLKADDIERTILANKIFAGKSDIPLHLGVTEAGTFISGAVKSAIGLGFLLKEGIGDTIRVSLTENPVMEVRTAYEILKSLVLRTYGPEIISCPVCGRAEVNIEKVVKEIEKKIFSDKNLLKKSKGKKIAVMGCAVNGPGEAKEADFGVCGGKGRGVWIEKGKQVKVLKEKDWIAEIIKKIAAM
ncbi:MAG: flavodoxin-dependent (E)-4-hydroxy-3-methylbut-2-enyl-diphosphate synthase [Elusimicrobia bacterium]|nr:flavodoxin-dependent (E)-4-hydroxy-3-methylbut-2-enyl-diphosphate synthase [Elusimicrobiota bacterium]